jgi:predicted acylesterase/phospholipase RssA
MALFKPLRPIVIANQGGAALNAFGWGALEAILLDPRFHIVGASGTSSGALNVVAMTEGLLKGDRHHAVQRMNEIWHELSTYQSHHLPVVVHVSDAGHALYNTKPVLREFASAARTLGNHAADILSSIMQPTSCLPMTWLCGYLINF